MTRHCEHSGVELPEKRKFAVGDRVAVYQSCAEFKKNRLVGTVIFVGASGDYVEVRGDQDDENARRGFHPKQLRRLIQSHRALQKEMSEAREAFRKLNLQALENHNRMTMERDTLRTELEESARLHGMGSEREAALMAKLDRLTKERDFASQQWREWNAKADDLAEKLAIAVEALEKIRDYLSSWGSAAIEEHEPERQAYAHILNALDAGKGKV